MSIAEVIAALGGTNALAADLGVLPSAVRNWRAAGAFPLKWHKHIMEYAATRGVTLDGEMFQAMSSVKRVAVL